MQNGCLIVNIHVSQERKNASFFFGGGAYYFSGQQLDLWAIKQACLLGVQSQHLLHAVPGGELVPLEHDDRLDTLGMFL
jgi:hypothetical protein